MSFKLLLQILLSLLVTSCLIVKSEDVEGSNDYMMELTDGTFEDAVKEPEFMIVEFYADWCVHCQKLLPTFQRLARTLKEEHNVTFAKLNVGTEKETQAKYQIPVLPGVRFFRRGAIFDYGGPAGEESYEGLLKYFLSEKDKTDLADNPVLQLSDANFDEITKITELILVEFFVKECMPCKRLEPHFVAAARRLAKNDPPVPLGTVNVPDNMDLTKRFGLQQYPYLVMLRYGEMYNYTGPQEEDGIVSYMERQSGPSSVFMETLDEVKSFMKSDTEARGVGFFSPETSADALKTFLKSGNEARLDLRLGHTTDPAIAQKLSFPLNSVVIFQPKQALTKYELGYTIIHDTDEGETPTSLMKAYQAGIRSFVGQMTRDNHLRAYKYRPLLVAYYDVNWDFDFRKDTKYWHSLVADVAIKYKDSDLAFAIANEAEFQPDLKALGFGSWGEDVAVGIYAPGPKKYRLTEELTKDSLTEFVEDFFSGNLKPYYNSEIPPKKNTGPVKTVVGTTFEKIVYNPKNSVILMMCIPSVADCRDAAEWFDTAARKFFKKDKTVVFGSINVELNDVSFDHFKFDDLPTFFYSPKGSKGETDLIKIDPVPKDDIDLFGWLRSKARIQLPRDEL